MLKCSRKREAAEDRGHGRDALQIHCLQGIYSSLSSKHCNVAWTTHHSTHAEKLYLIVYWLELNSWNCMTDTHVTELWHMFDRLTNTDRWPISVTLHWHTGHTDRWHISVTLTHWTHWQMTDLWHLCCRWPPGTPGSTRVWRATSWARVWAPPTSPSAPPPGPALWPSSWPASCVASWPGRYDEWDTQSPGQSPVRPPRQDVMMSETHNQRHGGRASDSDH